MNNNGYQPNRNQPVQGNQRRPYPPQNIRPQNGGPNANYPNPNYRPPKQKKKRGFTWQLVKFLLVLIVIAAIGAGIYVGKTYMDVTPYTTVFLDGVTVDGIDLGGMTWEEGNTAVRSQIIEKLGSWYIRLRTANGDYKDITAETLNITRDPADALEAAWAVGHDTSTTNRKTIFELQQDIVKSSARENSFSSVQYDADTSEIDTILSKVVNAAYIEPQDARMDRFQPDSVSEPFTYIPEVVGRQIKDADALREKIIGMVDAFESGEVLIEMEPLYPSQTVAELENKYYTLRSRAVTPIDTSSTDARNENIELAFAKINGQIINDGAPFSFNGIVGKRSQTNGFLRAYEYNYGDLVWGFGGGVCQASTTVYLAAMNAGMTLEKHTAHSQKVSYTDLGLDATVSDTTGREKDMAFRNNSGGQIFIAAHLLPDPANKKRKICEVRIYGMALGDISYNMEAQIVKVLDPPIDPVYKEDTDAKYVTFTDEYKIVSQAAEGYVVDTYLVTLQNGAEIARERITTSTYAARAQKIYTGVTVR